MEVGSTKGRGHNLISFQKNEVEMDKKAVHGNDALSKHAIVWALFRNN